MKKLSVLLALMLLLMPVISMAQLINVNPDPNGEPWYAGITIATNKIIVL